MEKVDSKYVSGMGVDGARRKQDRTWGGGPTEGKTMILKEDIMVVMGSTKLTIGLVTLLELPDMSGCHEIR